MWYVQDLFSTGGRALETHMLAFIIQLTAKDLIKLMMHSQMTVYRLFTILPASFRDFDYCYSFEGSCE
jgi:hypothetical protein